MRWIGASSRGKRPWCAWRTFEEVPSHVTEDGLYHLEKFVVIVVLVPVILALHHAQANHRFVHLAKSLVVLLIGAGIGERPLVDHFALLAMNVQPRFVWIACRLAHKNMCHIVIRFARP